MSRTERVIIAIAVFVAFYAILTLLVTPLVARQTGSVAGLLTIFASALLTGIVFWLARRRRAKRN